MSRRITRMVPHLRRSASSSFETQPFRAGLTFGGRPSGPWRRDTPHPGDAPVGMTKRRVVLK